MGPARWVGWVGGRVRRWVAAASSKCAAAAAEGAMLECCRPLAGCSAMESSHDASAPLLTLNAHHHGQHWPWPLAAPTAPHTCRHHCAGGAGGPGAGLPAALHRDGGAQPRLRLRWAVGCMAAALCTLGRSGSLHFNCTQKTLLHHSPAVCLAPIRCIRLLPPRCALRCLRRSRAVLRCPQQPVHQPAGAQRLAAAARQVPAQAAHR